MLSGIFDLRCRACSYIATNLNRSAANAAIKEHRRQHHDSTSHVPDCVERLPVKPVVGDRVRIKGPVKDGDKDPRKEFESIYGDRAYSEHIVGIEFDRKLYGEEMFQLVAQEGEPHILVRPKQVELAWRSDEERRVGLEARQREAAA